MGWTLPRPRPIVSQRTCHSHLTHQVHVFLLVFFSHKNVGPVGLEVTYLTYTKFLNLFGRAKVGWGEGKGSKEC